MATAVLGTRRVPTNATWYWIIGAVVLAAMIIFFSIGRETATDSTIMAPATMSAPTDAVPGTTANPGIGAEDGVRNDPATEMNRESGVAE